MDRKQQTIERMIAWLQVHSPKEWHGVACTWNWDQGAEIPLWIVRQKECDAGTAARIFWLCAPEDFLDRPEGNAGIPAYMADRLSIVMEIVGRWNAGGYATRHYYSEGSGNPAYPKECLNPDISLPVSLCEPFDGDIEDDASGYEDGIPLEVKMEVYALRGETPPDNFLRQHNLQWDGIGYQVSIRPKNHFSHFQSGDMSPDEIEKLIRDRKAFSSEKDYDFFLWNVIYKRLLDEERARKKNGQPYDEVIRLQARMSQSREGDWLGAWEQLIAPKRSFSNFGRISRIFGRK